LLFGTTDLVNHFANLATENRLPSFETLQESAYQLSECYSSPRAYEHAKSGTHRFTTGRQHYFQVPDGPVWKKTQKAPARATATSHKDRMLQNMDLIADDVQAEEPPATGHADDSRHNNLEKNMSGFDETDSESSANPMDEEPSQKGNAKSNTHNINDSSFGGDWVLANSMLLLRNGIWFTEVCQAVTAGDIGRVWEILKVLRIHLSI